MTFAHCVDKFGGCFPFPFYFIHILFSLLAAPTISIDVYTNAQLDFAFQNSKFKCFIL